MYPYPTWIWVLIPIAANQQRAEQLARRLQG
jgi:hypothetical protein